MTYITYDQGQKIYDLACEFAERTADDELHDERTKDVDFWGPTWEARQEAAVKLAEYLNTLVDPEDPKRDRFT